MGTGAADGDAVGAALGEGDGDGLAGGVCGFGLDGALVAGFGLDVPPAVSPVGESVPGALLPAEKVWVPP